MDICRFIVYRSNKILFTVSFLLINIIMLKKGSATFFSFVFILTVLFAAACNNGNWENASLVKEESYTKGQLQIAIDESLQPIMDQELNVFESSSSDIQLTRIYSSEEDAIRSFFEDQSKLIVITRDLNKSEKDILTQKGITSRSLAVAEDAVTFIVNPKENALMTTQKLKEILTGESDKKYTIVFNSPTSSIVNFILDTIIPGQKLSSNTYALANNEEMIQYVASHENAIGVLGVSSVYDPKSKEGAGKFREEVKVVALKDAQSNEYFQPYQAMIAYMQYPYRRKIYFIHKESKPGPASNFANFLSGERGQLIFNKARLLPLRADLTFRQVEIKH